MQVDVREFNEYLNIRTARDAYLKSDF